MADQFKLYKYFWNLYKSVCICFRRKLCGITSWKWSIGTQLNANRIYAHVVDFIECDLVECANTGQITDILTSFKLRRYIEMNDNTKTHNHTNIFRFTHTHKHIHQTHIHNAIQMLATSHNNDTRRQAERTKNNTTSQHKAQERTKYPFRLDTFVMYYI